MKNFKMIFALMALVMTGAAMAGTPVKTLVPVDHIYSPLGFDTNDNTEVIVTGWLPNLCHKSPMTEVELKGMNIHIKVTSLKYQDSNPFCPQVAVPFVESVNVGVLDKGKYKIFVNKDTMFEKKSKIGVDESTSDSVDEHVYADVEYVEKKLGSREVTLKGYNPSDCMVLEKIDVVSNGTDTYSVLPKMKQISDFCPQKMVPFEYEMTVPDELKKEKVLLHVRVMEGKSVNTIFENTEDQ